MQDGDVEDIVRKFAHLGSTETFPLLDRTGTFSIVVPKACLLQCMYFDNRLTEQPDLTEIRLPTSKESLTIFRAFILQEEYGNIPDVYDVMCLAVFIQCEEFAQYCAQAATGIVMPDSVTKETIDVIKEIVRFLPLRAFDQYLVLLQVPRGPQDNFLISNSVKSVLRCKDEYAYRPLPVPLFTKKITVAIMFDCDGNRMMGYLNDNRWIPIDLFGGKFCFIEEDVANFYLCLNQYVVFVKSDGVVMRKLLHADDKPQQLFTNCKYFVSTCNKLYVVCEEDNAHVLYKWDKTGSAFAQMFSTKTFRVTDACGTRNGHLQLQFEALPQTNPPGPPGIPPVPGHGTPPGKQSSRPGSPRSGSVVRGVTVASTVASIDGLPRIIPPVVSSAPGSPVAAHISLVSTQAMVPVGKQGIYMKLSDDNCIYSTSVCRSNFSDCPHCSKNGINEDGTFINMHGTWSPIEKRLHVGYNVLQTSTLSNAADMHETVVYSPAAVGGFKSMKTQIHGRIISCSDVLLL